MRYETPECVLLGEAAVVVLGGRPYPIPETMVSSPRADLVGYDE
jgi:hypothetical protein